MGFHFLYLGSYRRYLDWMVGGKYLTGRHGFESGILKGIIGRGGGGDKGEG